MLAFAGGAVALEALPDGCSGQSSSGVFVTAQRDERTDLGGLDLDVLRRLEREAADAIAEAVDGGTSDEEHIRYMRKICQQCREELARRSAR